MQNLSPSPPPPLLICLLPSLHTPCHLVYASVTFVQFPFSPLPISLSRDLPPSSFSTLRVTSRLHQCISQIPSLNSKGWGKGVSHIKVTRCSSSRLWCKRSLIQGFRTENQYFLPLNVLLMVLHKEISMSNIKHLILCVGVCQIRPEPRPDKSP